MHGHVVFTVTDKCQRNFMVRLKDWSSSGRTISILVFSLAATLVLVEAFIPKFMVTDECQSNFIVRLKDSRSPGRTILGLGTGSHSCPCGTLVGAFIPKFMVTDMHQEIAISNTIYWKVNFGANSQGTNVMKMSWSCSHLRIASLCCSLLESQKKVSRSLHGQWKGIQCWMLRWQVTFVYKNCLQCLKKVHESGWNLDNPMHLIDALCGLKVHNYEKHESQQCSWSLVSN